MVDVAMADARHGERARARDARRLAERQVLHVGHADVLGPLPGTANPDRLLRAIARAVGTREHDGAAGVGDEADVEQVEGIDHRPRGEHVRDRERLPVHRFGIQARPRARRDRDLRPLLERGAVLVHVARGDERELRGRGAVAVRDLVLAAQRGVARARDADARAAALSV